MGPIALGTIRTSFVLGGRLVVQAGTLLLVARLLDPEQFGAFAGIAALALILGALSTFGTQWILLDEVSKEPGQREHVLRYAIPTTFLCSCLLLIFYLLLGSWMPVETSVSLNVLLAIGSAEILLQPLLGLMASEHHALGGVARAQLLHMIPMILRLLVATGALMLALHNPLAVYAGGYVVASVLALGIGLVTLPARWPSWRQWRLPRRQECFKSSGYAVINITKSAPAELDKVLAFQLLPLGAAGLYAIGARVVGAITLPVIAMLLAALPRLFREKKARDTPLLLSWMYGGALAYSFLLAIVLWVSAPVFDVIFGEQYQGAGGVIRLLCIAIPGVAMRLVAGNVLMALGSPWMRVGFEVAGMLVLVTTSIALTTQLGTIGLPLAVACSEWAMAIIGGFLTYYVIKKPRGC